MDKQMILRRRRRRRRRKIEEAGEEEGEAISIHRLTNDIMIYQMHRNIYKDELPT